MAGKKERNSFFIIALLLILAVAAFLMSLIFKNERVLDEKEFPVKFQIAEITGLMVDESLDFGRIIHNSKGKKTITIRNYYDFPVVVELSAEGEVKDFLVFEEKIFLGAGEAKGFTVETIVFEDEPYGVYTGTLRAVFKKAR